MVQRLCIQASRCPAGHDIGEAVITALMRRGHDWPVESELSGQRAQVVAKSMEEAICLAQCFAIIIEYG